MMRFPVFPRPGREGRRVFGHCALLTTLVVASLGMWGCNDNPFCVYSAGACDPDDDDDGPPVMPEALIFPTNGSWILSGAPRFTSAAPEGAGAHPESVIALQFSESLSPQSLSSPELGSAFELLDAETGFPETIVDPPPLLGNGRIVLLIPMNALVPAATYSIRLSGAGEVTDLTSEPLVQPSGGEFGTFTVGDPVTSEPQLILTWPPRGSDNQSDLTEILTVFDRPMDSSTFNLSSWQVKVGDDEMSATPPAVNPFPVSLQIDGMAPVTQVWTWSSQQAEAPIQSLGVDTNVYLVLSEGVAILDETGEDFDPETIDFTIAPVRVPTAAAKHPNSDPPDALGGPNLLDSEPVLQVELADPAEANDTLRLYLTGRSSNTNPEPETLSRSIDLAAGATTVDVFPDDLDLLSSTSPIQGRLGDGLFSIALSYERGSVRTPVRLADADPSDDEPQPLLFDVTPPTLVGLGTSGMDTASFASDLSDFVIVGRANEEIRRVEVMTPMGDNWVDPEIPNVVSGSSDGLFVAKPVDVDILDSLAGTLDYEVLIYDRALNPAAMSVLGAFDQLGAVGPGAALPGPTVKVDVFDATTLERKSGALVMTHQEDGGIVTPIDSTFTETEMGQLGHAELDSAVMGLTHVTVQLDGYDTFTIEALRREVLQVPLRPEGLLNAFAQGTIASEVDVSAEENYLGDSRRIEPGELLFDVGFCSLDGMVMEFFCPFGPDPIQPTRIGGQSLLSADDTLRYGDFTAEDFLKAFALRLPAAPVDPGATEDVELEILSLLEDLDAEEQALAITEQTLSSVNAVNLGPLSSDSPIVTIEAVSPGTYGNLVMGLGIAYPPDDAWKVLGAYPGVADGIDGLLVSRGTIEGDLLLRAELLDTSGNRVGARPRFSALTGTLTPPDVPELLSPAPGGSSGGTSYVLDLRNVIDGRPVFYRVTLTDSGGRRWVLWREDTVSGAATRMRVVVPDLTGFPGGMQLENGPISCQVSVFSFPDSRFSFSEFMWTDIERQYDLYGHAATVTFSQP